MITFFTRQIMVLLFILLMYIKQSYTEISCGLREVNHPDCVKIFECPALFQHLQKPLSSETKTMLQRSQCGFEKIYRSLAASLMKQIIRDVCIQVCCPPKEHKNLHLLPQVECGVYDKSKVIGGEQAELNEFPWMALLSYKTGNRKTFSCAGSLINNKYVLTANHCLGNGLYGVRIGEHEIGRKKDCVTYLDTVQCSDDVQDFKIEKHISHENYIKESSSNDIALLRLEGTVNMARGNAKPICLPISTQMKQLNLTNLNMTVAGWGTTETKFRSNVLLKAIIPVVSSENCNTIRRYLTPNKLCAGELGKDSCKGDSGGPLISLQMNERQLTYVQFGIVSYGTGKCGGKKHGIYTRVTEYMDWILNNLEP